MRRRHWIWVIPLAIAYVAAFPIVVVIDAPNALRWWSLVGRGVRWHTVDPDVVVAVRWWMRSFPTMASCDDEIGLFECELRNGAMIVVEDREPLHGLLAKRGLLPRKPIDLGSEATGLMWFCWFILAAIVLLGYFIAR